MIASVSGTATAAVTAMSSADSSAELASLKSQLAEKQSELEQAESAEDKSTINAAITALKSEISVLQTSNGKAENTSAGPARTRTDTTSGFATADKAAPEGRMKSAAMDVLMRLGPQGGMMHPGGMNMAGGPPDVSQLYSEMDADSDGAVTEDEFVSGRPDRMSEDEATKLYAALDTEDTGAITEEQLAQSMQPHGRSNGHPPGGTFTPADGRMMDRTSDTTIAI